MANQVDARRLRAMKAAASYAVKHAIVADCALGKIAVRGALVSARDLGCADLGGVTAMMTSVMQSSGQVLDAISLDEGAFTEALSKISEDALAMALAENAAPVDPPKRRCRRCYGRSERQRNRLDSAAECGDQGGWSRALPM